GDSTTARVYCRRERGSASSRRRANREEWPREESNLRAWIRSPPLYPLSYGAESRETEGGGGDSNPRPPGPQPGALPTELPPPREQRGHGTRLARAQRLLSTRRRPPRGSSASRARPRRTPRSSSC